MRVVLDSNVLLVAIGKRSKHRPIWQAFLKSQYQLILSEDIVHEYEEILLGYSADGAAGIVMSIFAESPDVIYKRIFFTWNAIPFDPDDNKFFDAAVAGNADYLVTNDGHFDDAKKIEFPKINIISSYEFLDILAELT